ncbi:hypothetical protein [Streptomyces lavendulae]|uniref:hypothetical protein n=1 Tax=Streptomyces lavendulae TaxID=1914 RepID=UPI0024A4764D|nr:hypothetical protein [Streptomyces lavendulae]GLX21379.1 hypothetical protein Slala01_50230 [Streptomyces lavendulae subsp. lavendulae]GLX27897.1 hypothetical protein Slala02_37170 [Streptomyces lavendulae subsp. lavendulae]
MQSPLHAHADGTAVPAPSPFLTVDDPAAYAAAVEQFLNHPSPAAVPVWTGGRPDLTASVGLAATVYSGVRRPAPHARGVLLSPGTLPAGLAALIAPLAEEWLDEKELPAALSGPGSLVIAGLYEDFTLDPLWDALLAAARRADVTITFLTGRDAASLAWFTAKQYAAVAADVRQLGLYTSTDRPLAPAGIHLRDERGVEGEDTRSEILGTRWRRILFQGHGKDDSINLADFTVCGLNETAPRAPGRLGPACAYGPTCYKPMDKLIQLREVRAAEIVLSSCNNAPFADAAIYDPKYQLMLNAIDGTAKDVVAAVTIHDSDRVENRVWMDAALSGAPSAPSLNAGISTAQPFPAYLHFGMAADDTGPLPEPPSVDPEPLLLTTSARLTAYLAGGLLPPGNPLRPRLGKLAAKVEGLVTRRSLAVRDQTGTMRGLLDDLQSVDQAIAARIAEDPENELSDYPAHFGDRSRIDASSAERVLCPCGRAAERYTRRALVPTALDTECVVCPRCGDVSLRLPGAPTVLIHADDEVPRGGTLRVRLVVRGARTGPLRVGVHVPRYLRAACAVEPALQRIRVMPDEDREAEFTLSLSADTSPQAYYLTAFAVQDLAVTMARRHFGVVPA